MLIEVKESCFTVINNVAGISYAPSGWVTPTGSKLTCRNGDWKRSQRPKWLATKMTLSATNVLLERRTWQGWLANLDAATQWLSIWQPSRIQLWRYCQTVSGIGVHRSH